MLTPLSDVLHGLPLRVERVQLPPLHRITDLTTGASQLVPEPQRSEMIARIRREGKLPLIRDEKLEPDHTAYAAFYGENNERVDPESRHAYKWLVQQAADRKR